MWQKLNNNSLPDEDTPLAELAHIFYSFSVTN